MTVGSQTITASYSGDSNFSTSTSAGLTQTVNQASTSTTVSSSVNPSSFGESVIFTATVGPVTPGAGTPSGTISFYDGATLLGTATLDSSGVAHFTISTLARGSHSITTHYSGDIDFDLSLSAILTQVIN